MLKKVILFFILSMNFFSFSQDIVIRDKQTMIASWYGVPYHGRKTASGTIYNMYELTAAHKTLAFGTKLLVSNPINNNSIEVVITDRGPFIEGRDLDLSYAAMKELDLIDKGVSKVLIEILN